MSSTLTLAAMAHDFRTAPGLDGLCVECHCPGHCLNCNEGLRPTESHLYRNAATGRHEYNCLTTVVPEPLKVSELEPARADVHVVRPVRRRARGTS